MTGEVDNVPIGAVAANEADAVTAFDTEPLQDRGAPSNAIGEVGRADGLEISPRARQQKIGTGALFESVKKIGECFHGSAEKISTMGTDEQK